MSGVGRHGDPATRHPTKGLLRLRSSFLPPLPVQPHTFHSKSAPLVSDETTLILQCRPLDNFFERQPLLRRRSSPRVLRIQKKMSCAFVQPRRFQESPPPRCRFAPPPQSSG
eukprot:767667-Hanusia_phi.AAC.1